MTKTFGATPSSKQVSRAGQLMSQIRRSMAGRLVLAVGMVVLAFLITLPLSEFLAPTLLIFLYPAVMLSAWVGGLYPALVAGGLSILLVEYFIIPTVHGFSLDWGELVRVVSFLASSAIIGLLADSRRRAMDGLAGQEEWLRVTLSSIGDAVLTTDAQGRITFLNPVAERLTGWSREEAVGRPIELVLSLSNQDTGAAVSPVTKVLRERRVVELANHTVLVARDGRRVPLEDSGAPILDDRGRLVGVVLVLRDATAVRAAQIQLERQAALLDLSPSAIFTRDAEDRITFWSNGAEALYGWTSAEVLGEIPHTLLQTRLPIPAEEHYRVLREQGHWEGDVTHVRRDGSQITVLSRQTVQRDARGMIASILETNTDITARMEAERALEQALAREQAARAEAEAAVRLRDHFIDVASHELRNPLTTMMGYAELLARPDGLENPERAQRGVKILHHQTVRLNKMIGALLDVTRIVEGKFTLERAPFDLTLLVKRVVEESGMSTPRHVIQASVPPGPMTVDGDEIRLEQVLQNLIGNAIKYSPKGGSIKVEAEPCDRWACLTVTDCGLGIPADALPHLFRRFYRAPNAQAQHIPGLGIGLFVIQEIVGLHGGNIEVTSVEGKGTTFTVRLPLAELASSQ